MRLADYLDQNGIKRTAFAAKIGVSPATVTGWCEDAFWPGKENAKRIWRATDGAVTPNDFMDAR